MMEVFVVEKKRRVKPEKSQERHELRLDPTADGFYVDFLTRVLELARENKQEGQLVGLTFLGQRFEATVGHEGSTFDRMVGTTPQAQNYLEQLEEARRMINRKARGVRIIATAS